MDDIERLLMLMDMQKALARYDYDRLGLNNLDKLRNEVYMEIEKLKNKGKSKE